MLASRKGGSHAEESAEVEVLFANMEKMRGLTRKIQGSLNRLDQSGKAVQEAVGPIYGNTQRLQTANKNIDRVIEAIERVQAPRDQTNREEHIIQAGPRNGDLRDYMASLDRSTQTLSELKRSNLRANQTAIGDLSALIKYGTKQLEDVFRDLLREASAYPVDPLEYVVKNKLFPVLPSDKASTLRLIHQHISESSSTLQEGREASTQRIYAEIRGEFIMNSLRTLAMSTLTSVKKKSPDAIYQQGTNGIGIYAQGLEGLVSAEYESLCPIFPRDDWARVITATCQPALGEFSKTLRELNGHIQKNLLTDCFLAFEVVGVVSALSLRLETKTMELKHLIADSVKPIRETAKASLGKLLEDTRTRVNTLVALPMDGAAVPVTSDTMTRLHNMAAYLEPLASIMRSLGPGGWTSQSGASFDVGADGKKLFADYAAETIDTLLQNLEGKARLLLKGKSLQGVFLANNVAIVDRMVRSEDLRPLLKGLGGKIDAWRKKSTAMYMEAWREPSAFLLDVQYTNRSRPQSGGGALDSAALIKSLGSKEKDAIKEKFKNFNTSFDELVSRHKSYKMERDVRIQLGREVQSILEPLYGRFWDKYHEIDKGKGKYVKYDKNVLGSTLASLAS
ncbi:exocyst complex protein exo70 [Sporormia fimetaria CBS 119925]|uniref:Exocyst complex protein EXO70 n=1 Tax=Sporormia fimetaria CBS 119925 TaxID=1340428 RepID=A0A6A6VE06_9PLEO|nr:exocyst complex protein exo70 [Sporormia fimetaria CBS 119925]